MKLDAKALGLACGLLWGGCILLVGLVAQARGVQDGGYYGADFLLVTASIYPGYRGVPELSDTLLGAAYGLADGAIAGVLLAWLYNLFGGSRAGAAGS